jgi:hypothetical protein
MTIAACYLSTEGVVLGADSTTTMFVAAPGPPGVGAEHHFNYAQKVFQIGMDGSLGMTMWGLGALMGTSYRTLIAEFADALITQPPATMQETADRWAQHFWNAYSTELAQFLARAQDLRSRAQRTPDEENELTFLMQTFSGGFCLGGCCLPNRLPEAFEVIYSPDMTGPATSQPQALGSAKFWGCPNLIHRLIFGVDFGILEAILQSGKWSGSQQELVDLVRPYSLGQPMQLPIREAIDWVHASTALSEHPGRLGG